MTRWRLVDGVRVDLTPEEEAAKDAKDQAWNDAAPDRAFKELRNKRNNLLAETDWIVTKAKETDTDVSDAWKTYRQELRDLTNGLTTVEDIENVTYPTKPGA